MPATVQLRVFHGASPGLGADVTGDTLRFKRADNDTQDAVDPVPIPASGDAYSWRKVVKLVATTAPSNRLANLRFFSGGESLGTGRTVLFSRTGSYVQPSIADQDGPIGGTDVDDLTSGAPEVIQAGTFISSGDSFPYDGGALQDYVNLQMKLASNALAGAAAAAKTLTYRYDEA